MRKLALGALALLLALPTVGLNARSAAALTATTADGTQATVQTDMLQTLNDHRASVGAPTIAADARVNAASQNHANYSSANGYMGHYETSGLPYYTGYAPHDRLVAAGWSTTFVSEAAPGGPTRIAGVNPPWDGPYHRP